MRTLLDRYVAGDKVEVWNELVALGEATEWACGRGFIREGFNAVFTREYTSTI
jgi:hypothetical protein